jgi:hypothetical protein
MHYSFAPAAGSDPHLASIFLLEPLRSDRSPSKRADRLRSAPAALQPNTQLACVWLESLGAEPSQPAPAAVWMGSGRSGSAPGVIYPQDTRLLCLSKSEERSRSALVSPLPSPSSVPPSLSCLSRLELATAVELTPGTRAAATELTRARRRSPWRAELTRSRRSSPAAQLTHTARS